MLRFQAAIILVLICFCSFDAVSQSRKKKSAQPAPAQTGPSPTALNPGSSQQSYAPKKSSKKNSGSGKATYDQQRQYYERVEAVAKARAKEEKILKKPQYSNPLYFGHKKPPKKRPPGKTKFCKECGLKH